MIRYCLSGVGYSSKVYKERIFSLGLLPPRNLAVIAGKQRRIVHLYPKGFSFIIEFQARFIMRFCTKVI